MALAGLQRDEPAAFAAFERALAPAARLDALDALDALVDLTTG